MGNCPVFDQQGSTLHAQDEHLESLLSNWGRWAWEGGTPTAWPTACLSLEGRYEAPMWPGDENPPPAPDEVAGELVDCAWRDLITPHRIVLASCYVHWPWVRVKYCRTMMGKDANQGDADQYRARHSRMPMQTYLDNLLAGKSAIRVQIDNRLMLAKRA